MIRSKILTCLFTALVAGSLSANPLVPIMSSAAENKPGGRGVPAAKKKADSKNRKVNKPVHTWGLSP
jgi:hypothetical protein